MQRAAAAPGSVELAVTRGQVAACAMPVLCWLGTASWPPHFCCEETVGGNNNVLARTAAGSEDGHCRHDGNGRYSIVVSFFKERRSVSSLVLFLIYMHSNEERNGERYNDDNNNCGEVMNNTIEDENEDQSLKTLKCKSNFRLKILSAHGCSGY